MTSYQRTKHLWLLECNFVNCKHGKQVIVFQILGFKCAVGRVSKNKFLQPCIKFPVEVRKGKEYNRNKDSIKFYMCCKRWFLVSRSVVFSTYQEVFLHFSLNAECKQFCSHENVKKH